MERELDFLGDGVTNPERPFVVILGGAKVSDKIKVIDNLLGKANTMLIGGAMAYTFLAAQGIPTGDSLVEADKIPLAEEALRKAEATGVRLLLPIDHVVTRQFDAEKRTIASILTAEGAIPDGHVGVDIGPRTVELFSGEVGAAKTILWNGPMGVFEVRDAATGTFAIAKAVAESTATSIVGGGDSGKAIRESGHADRVTFISTGGGASLEFLEGTPLPGVEALRRR
jgi:3-phosphoglycerate kinase